MTAYDRAQANQRAAADPAANVFVTANAGSGKTKVLIDRIARLLLAGAQPASFLCITYTKAAAAEMQRRLFERLGAWCIADDATLRRALQELRGKDATVADAELPKARTLFAAALETPGGLKIQTIHAFCERLLARFPIEAGAPPGFDIADEARVGALMAIARARLAADDAPEVAWAFARFAKRLYSEHFEDLIGALTAQRGEEARPRELIEARHGAEGDAEMVMTEALARAPWTDLRSAMEVLLAEAGANNTKTAEDIRAAFNAGEEPEARWAAYRDVFLNEKGDARGNGPTKKVKTAHPFIDRLFAAEGETARLQETMARIRRIERAADAYAVEVLAAALAHAYSAAKSAAGLLDFEDLIAQARVLLTDAAAAPWVLYKLDGGVDHILIDEGQDTSPDQWALVAPLQDEFFAGAGAHLRARTVFAVGDAKQSIYSFQGADPAFFLEQRQALSTRALSAEKLFVAPNLGMSFRSTAEVLTAVDAVFDGEDIVGGGAEAQDLVRHDVSRAGQGGVVELWPITPRPQANVGKPWDAPHDIEFGATAPNVLARDVARAIKRAIAAKEGVWEGGKLRPMRAGDVLALVRTRGPLFQALIKAFKREGLPVAGADRMTLRDELAVEDCLALMRVALDPRDDLSLACVLKGPWLNLTNEEADIFPLAHGRAKGEALIDRLNANTELRFAEARAFAGELVARAGEDAFGFLAWALETPNAAGLSGWARVLARLGPEARDPIEELMERALQPGRHAAPTLQRFLADIEADEVEVKREMESGENAVRVMTVHGAKGLEAPVVILPDTTAPPKEIADFGLLIGDDGLYYSTSEKEDDPATAAVRAAFKQRARTEHMRLLYVAMTRARDRLIVCGVGRGNGPGTAHADSWHTRIAGVMATLGQEIDTPNGKGWRLGAPLSAEAQASEAAPATTLPAWARTPLAAARVAERAAPSRLKLVEARVLSPRGDGAKRFKRGRLIHGLLERLPDLPPQRRRDAARTWLTRQGVVEADAAPLAEEALAVLEAAPFAAAFGPDSRAETPIAGLVAGRPVRGVIDRLIVRAEDAMILDFKSDRPAPELPEDAPPGYVLQLALYRALIQQIFPARAVRCGLIWTERPSLTELQAAQMDAALEDFLRGA